MKKYILTISILILLTSCSVVKNEHEPALGDTPSADVDEQTPDEGEVIKTPPVITIEVDTLETVLNKPIDLLIGVNAVNYLGTRIDVVVSGNYSFNEVGTYNLDYYAVDTDGLFSTKRFKLVVEESPILCKSDDVNGIVPDNPYLRCDYVFPEDKANFDKNTIKSFDGTLEGRNLCFKEAEKYDPNEYKTDCIPLLNNVRGTSMYGLWIQKINN